MKSTLVSLLIFGISSLTVAAETKYLTLGKIVKGTVEAGKSASLEIPIEIGKEYHVQANPASLPRLIPTTVELAGDGGIEVGAPQYPKGSIYHQQGSDQPISVYNGKIRITIPVSVKAGTKPGEYALKGKVRYQACNEKTCFFPTFVPFEFPLRVK